MRSFLVVALLAILLAVVGCGGGSGSSGTATAGGNSIVTSTATAGGNTIASVAANVAPLVVDGGPVPGTLEANTAFTTITVCVPGSTTNCQTINHIAVDIGSSGLRLLASSLTQFSASALTNVNGASSSPLAECITFIDNTFIWGAVKYADVKMGGPNNTSEMAASVPIMIMGDSSVPSPPASCSEGGTETDTLGTLGANGLLGVGTMQYDCDILGQSNGCTSVPLATPPPYYLCNGNNCSTSTASLAQQVRNPVSLFGADNNGTILELPKVPVGGQSTAAGSLVFGIGTESNNGIGGATVLTIDTNVNDFAYGGITTGYNGQSYPNSSCPTCEGSFLDSGSNGIFFLDAPLALIPVCDVYGDWYCPSPALTNKSASNTGANGASHTIDFNITSANTLFSTNNTAFSDLAGPNSGSTVVNPQDEYFDWGLSFFYGRNVYTSIYGVNSQGAYWAW